MRALRVNIRENNVLSRQEQRDCFNKNQIQIILKLLLTLTARKNFVSVPRFRKQKPLVSWFSGLVGKTVSWKMKNAAYFSNHDTLIRTLQARVHQEILHAGVHQKILQAGVYLKKLQARVHQKMLHDCCIVQCWQRKAELSWTFWSLSWTQ